MRDTTFVERVLHLRSGDFQRGLPLFGYYFLIIASSQVGQVARDALFLDRFEAIQLPYADIVISVLIGFVVALYIRISRRTSLRNLLIGSLCFYAANLAILWAAVHFLQWPWLYLVLYVWVGIFGVLAPAQVWTLANFVWTTREAKRRFSMLGSGGIIGGIFAGFFSVRMAGSFGTESLLLFMALLLGGAICCVVVTLQNTQTSGGGEDGERDGPRNLFDSFRLIAESRHLQAIAVLIFLSSIVTTTGAWQMKAIAQDAFVEKNALAVFFGRFDGYTGILALAAQLFLTGKVLNRFGIGTALAALPLALMGSSVAVLLSGTLWAACLVKGSDRVFRYSIDTSAQQLLYLPVPATVKMQVKSFIDTVVWRFGGGFAGILLLIFATALRLSPSQIAWVNLVLVGIWLSAALFARRQYVAALSQSIQQFDLDPVPVLDRAATNVLIGKLKSSDSKEILQALSLFEIGHERPVYGAVRNLLDHPSAEVRARSIAILNSAGDTSVRGEMAELLQDESLEVRTEALSYISRHDHVDPLAAIDELGKFSDFSICSAAIAFLARPGETQNLDAARLMLEGLVKEPGEAGAASRRAAAQLIGSLPDYFDSSLSRLLDDSDPEVVRHAMRAVAALRKRRLIPIVIERLTDPATASEAVEVLASFENAILGTLRDYLYDSHLGIELRREIPQVLERIATSEAARVLVENLSQPDSVVRYRVIMALNKLLELHRTLHIDVDFVESVLMAEIMGHYRSYQILATLRGPAGTLVKASIDRELERIFRLMKVVYPAVDIENAYRGIQSGDAVTHANALEFLENTLNPSLRSLLIPVIDGEVSLAERMRLADEFLKTRMSGSEEAVAALASADDPWLKSSAAYAIEKLGLTSFKAEMERWARDPDPLLQRQLEEARSLLRS